MNRLGADRVWEVESTDCTLLALAFSGDISHQEKYRRLTAFNKLFTFKYYHVLNWGKQHNTNNDNYFVFTKSTCFPPVLLLLWLHRQNQTYCPLHPLQKKTNPSQHVPIMKLSGLLVKRDLHMYAMSGIVHDTAAVASQSIC